MKAKGGIFKKLHRWPGLIIAFVLLYYGLTGIIMNHRELFSGCDLNLSLMPRNYEYNNWNNASVKGSLIINSDSILVYGNIGVWLTDSTFSRYSSMNEGFPEGTDNHKIFDVGMSASGHLFAATLFGLYGFDKNVREWLLIDAGSKRERFTAIETSGDTVFALSRSHLYTGICYGSSWVFTARQLPAPLGYENSVSLFQTLWQMHSGEIFGLPGKLFVDILGIITIFLSVTGIIYFFFPGWIRRLARRDKGYHRIALVNKWSLKWHNKIGAWTFILLIILYFTGMFLRPPLLIAIGNVYVPPIKYTHLDQPNPWYDKLRDIVYDDTKGICLVATLDGIYAADKNFSTMVQCPVQPPVSVMGINTLEKTAAGNFLVGSFSGLFIWDPENPAIYDLGSGRPWEGETRGIPVGETKVTGTIRDINGRLYVADYDSGIRPVGHDKPFPEMPHDISDNARISLWNAMLEIHTGRIFQRITGLFYILIVPLAGLTGITVVISGYIVWKRKYKRQNAED